MSLSSTIEEFCAMIGRVVETLEEVSASSKTIPNTETEKLSQKFSGIHDSLDEVSTQLRTAAETIEEIRSRWG